MEFVKELQRRKVIRVAVVYVVTAWLLIQVAGEVAEPLRLPEWFSTAVIVLLALGFPVALGLAWAFEVRPEKPRGDEEEGDSEGADDQPRLEAAEPYRIARRSVAVLPFQNLSSDEDVAHFASGVTEEVLNNLSKLHGLKVASRASTSAYKDANLRATTIGEELGVSYLLEGSVRKLEDDLRITTQLIRIADDEQVWAHTIERSMTEGFQAQEEVARIVAHSVHATIEANVGILAAQRQTDNARAYQHFRIASEERWRSTIGDHAPNWTLVIENFRRAVEIDPQFAAAFAGLANSYVTRNGWRMSHEEASEKAHQAIEQAMALRPPSTFTYQILADIYTWLDLNYPAAKDTLGKGIAIAPNHPWLHHGYTTIAIREGRISDAVAHARTAAELAPGQSQIIGEGLALALWASGDLPGAQAAFEASLETMTSGPDHSLRLSQLALVLSDQREIDSLEPVLDRLAASTHSAPVVGWVALALARGGRQQAAERIGQVLLTEAENWPVPLLSRFAMHLGLEQFEDAFDSLSAEIDQRLPTVNFLRWDPEFLRPMREHPRWSEIMAQLEDVETRAASES